MASLLVAGRYVPARGLLPREAAWLLRWEPSQARAALDAEQLVATWAGRRRLVDVEHLVDLLAEDPLALEALAGLLEGRIASPCAAGADLSLAAAVSAAAGAGRPIAHPRPLASDAGPDERRRAHTSPRPSSSERGVSDQPPPERSSP